MAYSDSYYANSDCGGKFRGIFENIIDIFRLFRAKKISKILGHSGCILDVGCGNGKFLKSLSRYGKYELHGIERAGSSAERSKNMSDISLIIGELRKEHFRDNYFDVITLFHVFEHLESPGDYLQMLMDMLKPGGQIIFSFPNIDSWQAHFFKGKWLHLDPPRHLFFFTPSQFKRLMKKNNFNLIQESYLSFEQNPFGAIQSVLNCFHFKRELLFEYLKGNKNYTKDTNSMIMELEKFLLVLFFPIFAIETIVSAIFKKGATVEFIFRKAITSENHVGQDGC